MSQALQNSMRGANKKVLIPFILAIVASAGSAFQQTSTSSAICRRKKSRVGRNLKSLLQREETNVVTTLDPRVEIVAEMERNENKKTAFEDAVPVMSLAIEEEVTNRSKIKMLGLLWIVALLSSLDRVAMSVAIIPMSTEYGFTDTFKGGISSFFSIGYGMLILPAGLIVACASPRIVMACGLFVWSLATIATPLSASLYETLVPLLLVRAMVGAAESVVLPTIQRFLGAWTGPEEKSTVVATLQSGFQTGTILAYLVSPTVMDLTGGWRGLFYTYGGVGLLMLVPWLLFAQDAPNSTQPMKSAGLETVTESKTFTEKLDAAIEVFRQAPFREFLHSRGVWAMILAHSAKNWQLYQILSWTPTFYSQQYGIGVKDSAFLSILPSVAAIVSGLAAGNLADAIIRKTEATGETLTTIRKVFQSVGLYGPAFAMGSLAMGLPESPFVAQASLTAAVAMSSFNSAGFEAANQEKAGEKWAGLLYGVTTLPAVMFGTLGVYLTGQILDATNQDWSIVFGLTSIVSAIGATAFIALYDSEKEFD